MLVSSSSAISSSVPRHDLTVSGRRFIRRSLPHFTDAAHSFAQAQRGIVGSGMSIDV